jgi:hypothetical protein
MAMTAQLATSQCLEFLTKFLPGFVLGFIIIATLQRRRLSVKVGLIWRSAFPAFFGHGDAETTRGGIEFPAAGRKTGVMGAFTRRMDAADQRTGAAARRSGGRLQIERSATPQP